MMGKGMREKKNLSNDKEGRERGGDMRNVAVDFEVYVGD
jgi:hypothetical protein